MGLRFREARHKEIVGFCFQPSAAYRGLNQSGTFTRKCGRSLVKAVPY